MSDNNFLEYVRIDDEDFPPFEKWVEFNFNGHEQNKNLIEAYLKSKWGDSEDAEKNAERFKINCLLAHNGGGKSRFFEWVHTFLYRPALWKVYGEKWLWELKLWKDVILFPYGILKANYNINWEETKLIPFTQGWKYKNSHLLILDDFFKMSWNLWFSCNNSELQYWDYISLFAKIHSILKIEPKVKKVFDSFLNIDNLNTNLYLTAKTRWVAIFDHECNILNIESSFYLFEKYLNEDKHIKYLTNIFIYNFAKYVFEKSINPYSKERKLSSEKIIELWNNYKSIIEFIKKSFSNNKINLKFFNEALKLIYKYDYNSIGRNVKFEETLAKELEWHFFGIWWTGFKIKCEEEDSNKVSLFEKLTTLCELFNLDLEFKSRDQTISFNSLSWWQKTMLVRFTNIYMKILEEHKAWKTNFLILVDEPDLHLHLEWQRQYIGKLIDVFSTLDKKIKLHFIIATHSPFIISDLAKESIIILNNWKVEKYKWEAFWANYIDIIEDWFFFDDSTNKPLMWTFALESITQISKEFKALTFIDSYINDSNFEENKTTINKILKDSWFKEIEDFSDWENRKTEMFKDLNSKKMTIWDKYIRDNLSLI